MNGSPPGPPIFRMPNIGDSLPHSILRDTSHPPIFCIVNIGDSGPYGTLSIHTLIPDISYRVYRGFTSLQHVEGIRHYSRYFVSRISVIRLSIAHWGYPLYPPIFHIANIGDPVQLAALVGAIVPATVLAANNIWYLNPFSPCSSLYNIIKYIN